MRAFVLSLALITALPFATAAQTTPWGDPDLQGVWSNQSPVPLERPAALASKPFFTAAEARDVEKNALASTLNNVAAAIATSGEFNEIWLESEKGRVDPEPQHVARRRIRPTGGFGIGRRANALGIDREARAVTLKQEAGSGRRPEDLP